MNPSNFQVPPQGQPGGDGFSLTELLIAVTILGALIAIALPMFNSYKDQQNVSLAINDLRLIDNQIKSYKMSNEQLPDALSQVPQGDRKDPWGRLYQYLRIEGQETVVKGEMRRDKSTNPINTDFDLYSKGVDGDTSTQLNSTTGQDDVVRANDGQYFGLASKY